MRNWRGCRGLLALAALCLSACGSLPLLEHEVLTMAWETPEDTPIGGYFARNRPDDPDLSGFLLLDDPRDAFKARLGLAHAATRTLDMQYYLWKGDLTGRLLMWAALRAADRGVRVRFLIDDIYHSGRDDIYTLLATHPNFELRVFNPMKNRRVGRNLNYVFNRAKLNHRMHNKIFLADGAAGVLGGRNIGDDYFGVDPELNFHDLDVLAVGPVAKEAGSAFDLYWNSATAVPIERVSDRRWSREETDAARRELESYLTEEIGRLPYPAPRSPEDAQAELDRLAARLTWAPARIVVDPLERFEGAESAFAALGREINGAVDEQLTIQTAYLIPPEQTIAALGRLADRGVDVRVMTNSLMSNNHVSVHGHYKKYRKRLLTAGVDLYEVRADAALLDHYRREDTRIAHSHSGMHTKAFVVDDDLSIIGSYNMDPRSRVWNSEIALVIYGEAFGRKVLEVMDQTFESQNAFRLALDERGRIEWRLDGPDGSQVFTREPDSTFTRRFLSSLIRWIPIENEL